MMRSKKAGPAEELPAEGCDVSAPGVESKPAKKDHSRWFSAVCCAGVEEAVMEDLNTPPCVKSDGVVSTSGTNAAVLTEELWQELRNTLPSDMKMEDLIAVLQKISAWVKVAVKEVVAPGFESGLLGVRSSGGTGISSSPHEVEHGETHDSPSQINCGPTSRRSRAPRPLMYATLCIRYDEYSRSSTSSFSKPLRVVFGISEDRIFSHIYGEVMRAIMNMLPPEIKHLDMKETSRVMSAIVDDSLKQINSCLLDIYCNTDLHEGVTLPVSYFEDIAQNLMLAVKTRMLGFLESCTITSWSASVLLNSITTTKSIIECLLSVIPFCKEEIAGQLIGKDLFTFVKKRLEVLCMRQILTPSVMHLQALSDFIILDSFEAIGEKVISSGALEQNEESECSWKALDSMLSIDSLRQSSQKLIPIVRNLMLERIAALDQVKAQMSCKGTRSVLSDTYLSKEALQSGIVRSFVNTATEKLLQQSLGLTSCTKPDTIFGRYCYESISVTEADLEVEQSRQRCCSELSAVIAHTVISDLAGITTSQSEQDRTGSALQSAAQTVDVGLEKKSSRWFGCPRFLKLRFKKQTNKVRVHMEDQVVDKHIPDAPSTSDKTIPKLRRKSMRTRLATAFSKICRK
ncbi:uncharacterized protein LOC143487077 [Brachyhypopomus gauderio]|uniref:uncharacterized protein LOC143487077 n=1 Tax=Brachyhypopomus gauderio TaxID=698409 RepID=UPI0040416D91